MGRRGLLLVFLVGCDASFADEAEEGRYSWADAPDAKVVDGAPISIPDASPDAGPDAAPDAPAVDAGTCVRDESRDPECVGYDDHLDAGPDAAQRYAIACPADDAGNPVLPPPTIGCNYTGWADAGTLTMCCK